jgi:hypothetical protein
MLCTQGILDAPPMSSTAWMESEQFLDWSAAMAEAMSARTGTMMV